ncbi:MAG: hypothetical protein M1339_05950 [Bacteroidetes bacterium]|nr:hypothetical protein [Bacteroidota bacterium]
MLDPNPDETVVAFGDTYFGFDKSTLSEEAKTVLDSNVQALKDNPAIDVPWQDIPLLWVRQKSIRN